jgi:hypothetical protein
MIQIFFTQELTYYPQLKESTWFQQVGATSHTTRNSINVVQQLFPHHIIYRFVNISWVRSPYLTACDFFLRGYLKSKLYADRPQNIAELKQRIRDEIASIAVEMFRCVMGNMRSRL